MNTNSNSKQLISAEEAQLQTNSVITTEAKILAVAIGAKILDRIKKGKFSLTYFVPFRYSKDVVYATMNQLYNAKYSVAYFPVLRVFKIQWGKRKK